MSLLIEELFIWGEGRAGDLLHLHGGEGSEGGAWFL